MAVILLPFMGLAAVGLLLSIYVHLASLFGLPIPGGNWVWVLHIGIFVVWMPAVMVGARVTQGRPQEAYWKTVASSCPPWMRYAGRILFIYGAANFLWFMLIDNAPSYDANKVDASVVGLFSGHWFIFYGAAFAIFYSAYRNPRSLVRQTCPEGHEISATDAFCSTCGKKIRPPAVTD